MTLQEELLQEAHRNQYTTLWDEVKSDLEKAACNWESLTYHRNTAEDRLANFVLANKGDFYDEGITVTLSGVNNDTVVLSWA
ncbi:hypothetical protein D3P96_02805 [Weissella viridescens]|uniref:Uncharacterized protein n=1 Tax=Weissella viridescens TaxID=1629 RepID=A0A3P2RFH9_WEIVI|nr:hypothetical protein [Weissella viridescens]RRG18235.1 hypothetical protein D3P96_02805 [Weissella viridescens]